MRLKYKYTHQDHKLISFLPALFFWSIELDFTSMAMVNGIYMNIDFFLRSFIGWMDKNIFVEWKNFFSIERIVHWIATGTCNENFLYLMIEQNAKCIMYKQIRRYPRWKKNFLFKLTFIRNMWTSHKDLIHTNKKLAFYIHSVHYASMFFESDFYFLRKYYFSLKLKLLRL